MLKNDSIRIKLLLVLVTISILSVMTVTAVTSYIMKQILIEQANVALLTAAVQTQESVDNFLNETLATHRLQAQLPEIIAFLNLPAHERAHSQARINVIATLDVLCNNVHDVLRLSCGLLDDNGLNVLDSDPTHLGEDESANDYFQQPYQFNLPYISPITFPDNSEQPLIHFSYPIRNAKGKFIGVLRIRYNALALQNIVSSHNELAGRKSFAILLDDHNLYLGHGLSAEFLGTSSHPLTADLATQLQAEHRLSNQKTTTDLTKLTETLPQLSDDAPFFTAQVMGEELELVSGARAKLERQPWTLLFVQPRDVFLTPILTQLKTALVVAIGVVLGVILVAIKWGYQLTQPIIALTETVQRIDAGELQVVAEVTSHDEIGRLALAFNNMTAKLRELVASLQESNQQLAQKNDELRQLNRLKDEFLANTSHELRTPINGIIGLTESMINGATGALTAQQINNLQMVVNSGQRLAHLINDLLDFSTSTHKELHLECKAIYLLPLVEATLTLTRPTIQHKPVMFINALPPDLPPVYADSDRVQQILLNLIGNAAKFTHQGEITVSAMRRDEAQPVVAITISDTGIGIPEDKYEQIFRPFEQVDGSSSREYGGTGLGLAITKQLVNLHGGEITVISTPGQGSHFTFTLPISDQIPEKSTIQVSLTTIPAISNGHEATSATPGEHHILVVDDEVINRQVLVNQLKLHNYQVTTTVDGFDALRLMEGRETHFDLVLLDIMMPRMSGYDVCTRIRRHHPPTELPIIMLTAKNQPADLVRGFDVGANDYLTKPFLQAELLARTKTQIQLTDMRKLNRAKDRFFSIVAHDLKGPFMPLLGTSELLAEMSETLERAQIKDLSESLYRSATNVYNLLENLLNWARIQMGRVEFEPQNFDLNELIEINIQLLTEVAQHKQIRLKNELTQAILVYADRNMIDAVIRNLVSNALKFTETGGDIILQVHLANEPDMVEVAVTDNGIGMSEEDMAKLFKLEIHHTTLGTAKERGTGLGLIMCKDMVEQNGGQIGVESEIGQGTTFKFTLPLAIQEI